MNIYHIGLDWSQKTMALAYFVNDAERAVVKETPSDVKELKVFLRRLKGKKRLTFEEMEVSQWLFTELKDEVDELIVCDPYRNRLLSEGAKTDRVDAEKLARLLRGQLLKPVFHDCHLFIDLRTLVSGYEDLVQRGVRLKNQRSALFRRVGRLSDDDGILNDPTGNFVLKNITASIEAYEVDKKHYETQFELLEQKHEVLRRLQTIPGIGLVGAVKLAARVVSPQRFPSLKHFWSYCGLVKHQKLSGGRDYGRRTPRHCRSLKGVFKSAAFSLLRQSSDKPAKAYYNFLCEQKNYPPHQARHALARKVAGWVYGTWKSEEYFKPKKTAEI